jgi:hypothetical protein
VSGQLPRRESAWPMIIGVVVLAVLAIAVLLVLQSENAPSGAASPTGSPSASPSASTVAATTSAEASPSAPPTGLQVGAFVAPIADGVTLRETPGTSGVRIGELPRDVANLVVEGPMEADGYQWYRLSAMGLPPSSGCITPLPTDPLECPVWYGWAAAGEPADEAGWFEPIEVECPDPDQDAAGFLELPQRVPLGCYGSDPISFTAWHPELPEGRVQGEPCEADPAVAWLYCPESIALVSTSPEGDPGLQRLHVDPASGVVVPEPGQWLRITGAFDHPAAAACAEAEAAAAEDPDPDLAVLECRVRFVVQGVEVTAAP